MNGRIEDNPMITHVMPLEKINGAFELMHQGQSKPRDLASNDGSSSASSCSRSSGISLATIRKRRGKWQVLFRLKATSGQKVIRYKVLDRPTPNLSFGSFLLRSGTTLSRRLVQKKPVGSLRLQEPEQRVNAVTANRTDKS